ncbi:MAG: glucose-6-phosphate dehydrogenase assembly protein OpcA [Candidatus Dormibacteraeota bacterium]|nr:glucose-6-phosphate dehydrogenase assembly protein OpcA [Candidatus Dormibacteraeota bacterium]
MDTRPWQWRGRGIKADAVAAKMLELRHSASDDEGYPLARASVMNLIVFAAQAGRVDFAVQTVDELAVRHPARAIVVSAVPSRTFSLDAELALHRHPLAAHGLVYERAVMRAHGAAPDDLDTLVIPLLIPHLQSFLWWLGDPLVGDPGLKSLGAICDRLVIDSAMGPAERLRDLSELIAAGAAGGSTSLGRLVLGDVAWSRLDGFRRSLVQVFDEARRADFLDGVTNVEIIGRRGVRQPVSAAEILCAGWLASRLGWTTPAWARNGISLRHGKGHVALAFSGVRSARPSTEGSPLQGIRLHAELGRRRLSVELTAAHGEGHVTVSESGGETARRTIPLPQVNETEAVSRELARIGRDRVYEDALAAAARILGALEA